MIPNYQSLWLDADVFLFLKNSADQECGKFFTNKQTACP
jgi:hypothetical protein